MKWKVYKTIKCNICYHNDGSVNINRNTTIGKALEEARNATQCPTRFAIRLDGAVNILYLDGWE